MILSDAGAGISTLVGALSYLISYALSGVMLVTIGLKGIILADLATFLLAFITLVQVPGKLDKLSVSPRAIGIS
jgi:hypothetical protein